MSKRTGLTVFTCDFCGEFRKDDDIRGTEFPESRRWFEVHSPFKDDLHACLDCGHDLHYVLKTLGIEHEFVCQQYSEHPAMGEIRIAKQS